MKKVKILYKKISEGINLLAKKIIRIIRHIFKKGNTALWVLDGLVAILIIIIAINIFSRVRESGSIQYNNLSEEVSLESANFPKEAAVGEENNQKESIIGESTDDAMWKTLGSFGGVGSGKNSIKVNANDHWRIVLRTKTLSRETSILSLIVYREEYFNNPVEKFTKELEDRGDGRGAATDIVEVCDTMGGNFVVEIKSNNFDWNIDVEIASK
ncbi:MAG: hypothetical protein PHW43_11875 [Syntrophales bacterium]|nr:hypothetical protein [Syntrophales bacterium]